MMVDVDDGCQFSADSQPKSVGLVRGWAATPALSLHSTLAMSLIGRDDSTINTVVVISISIIKSWRSPKADFRVQNAPLSFSLSAGAPSVTRLGELRRLPNLLVDWGG